MDRLKGFTLFELILIFAAFVIAAIMMIGIGVLRADDGSFTTNRHWKQTFNYHSGTAGEAITLGQPVAYNRYSGKIYVADADDADRRPAIGVAGNTASADGDVMIVTKGIISGMPCGLGTETSSAITPIGTPLALSTTQGGITILQTAASGITQYLGYAAPLSQQAVDSGVTTGTDTYFINVAAPERRTDGGWVD
ncbi:MAG: hypothetical protein SV375_00075 [Thermodesulfobacteriota bacterium]|nr:hypothetical protein [Thermodesulfobacteriota bacterium]